MATQEQVQEALERLQAQEARIAALETQLQIEQTRAQTAELYWSNMIQTLGAMRQDLGGATKGIGQPFILKGFAEQDFGEWTHKVRTFMRARFRNQILGALIFGQHVNEGLLSRLAGILNVFGEQADEDDQIDAIDDFVGKLCAYLVSFTTDATARRVRPHVVHATRGDSSAGSEPSSMPAS